MIKFVLMVNKQGQTRLASYFEWFPIQERVALEAEIIRRCLSRTEYQVRAVQWGNDSMIVSYINLICLTVLSAPSSNIGASKLFIEDMPLCFSSWLSMETKRYAILICIIHTSPIFNFLMYYIFRGAE